MVRNYACPLARDDQICHRTSEIAISCCLWDNLAVQPEKSMRRKKGTEIMKI